MHIECSDPYRAEIKRRAVVALGIRAAWATKAMGGYLLSPRGIAPQGSAVAPRVPQRFVKVRRAEQNVLQALEQRSEPSTTLADLFE